MSSSVTKALVTPSVIGCEGAPRPGQPPSAGEVLAGQLPGPCALDEAEVPDLLEHLES